MRDFTFDHSALALNTATLGNHVANAGAGWCAESVIDACAEREIGAITFWKNEVADNPESIGDYARSCGIQISGLCRTPFLVGVDAAARYESEFQEAVDLAARLGSDSLTCVVGGLEVPQIPIGENLKIVQGRLERVLDFAAQAKVRIGLEPLHPVYAANRSCLTTVRDAIDICESVANPWLGLAIDVYHVWWDTSLASQFERVNGNWIVGLHVCDWQTDTADILNDRAMMGDGVIDIRGIRNLVEKTGFNGWCEVEIFSSQDWWMRDPDDVLDVLVDRFRRHA